MHHPLLAEPHRRDPEDRRHGHVRSRDTGFSLFNITFSEPTPAHEQVKSLMGACSRLTRVQVDYRELSFLIFGIPSVTVTGVCEQ